MTERVQRRNLKVDQQSQPTWMTTMMNQQREVSEEVLNAHFHKEEAQAVAAVEDQVLAEAAVEDQMLVEDLVETEVEVIVNLEEASMQVEEAAVVEVVVVEIEVEVVAAVVVEVVVEVEVEAIRDHVTNDTVLIKLTLFRGVDRALYYTL